MDTIESIGEHILKQISFEEEKRARQKAKMRVDASINGKEMCLWLYDSDYQNQRLERRNIHGDLVGLDSYENPPETVQYGGGTRISKNSLLGGELIKNRCNPFSYTAPGGEQKVEPFNFATYTPFVAKKIVDARTGTIRVTGEEEVRFSSLLKLLEQFKNKTEVEKKKKQLEQEQEKEKAAVLKQQITQLEQEIEAELKQQQRYIRESTELRMQPILDPEQETIKRSKILDGMLVIDGGPGTGKTTTLIQRINFLTAPTIKEYRDDLSDNEINDLENSWRFFSPSRLLKLFLKNSMAQEGLKTDDNQTKVWSEYLDQSFKKYTLINPSTQNPFIKAHNFHESVFPNDSGILQDLYQIIESALIEDIKKRLNRVLESSTDGLSWSSKAEDLKRKAKSAFDKETVEDFIIQFENWKERERDSVLNDLEDLNDELRNLGSRIQIRVKENEPELYQEISEHLKDRFEKRHDIEPDDEDEEETDDIDIVADTGQTFSPEIELSRFFRRLTSAKALRSLNKGFRRTKILRDWEEQTEFAFENIDLMEVGELLYFRRFTNRMTLGAGNAVLSRIPTVYKQIRSDLADYLDDKGYGNGRFQELVKQERKRLHTDEMNLILWFINQCIKDLKIASNRVFENLDHAYINAFKEEIKSVIAVDEATDFSILEIAAISSFADPDYSSVTLSGDLMQRMTSSGISNWDVMEGIFPSMQVERLTTSYRQSPTLLNLASKLYENVTGVKPDFKAYLSESSGEPQPVIVQIENNEEVSVWLEEQIIKVYTMYGNNIPSVAIFAEDDEAVMQIAKILQSSNRLKDVGITVRHSTSDSELVPDSQVCVYNIKMIKGMEFEAVFFVNIDKIDVPEEELLQKYLYVGLSRAAYYLGVSYRDKLPGSLGFLDK